jgi:antitoxin component YwqK of YwqJK toxin-antitoxin module
MKRLFLPSIFFLYLVSCAGEKSTEKIPEEKKDEQEIIQDTVVSEDLIYENGFIVEAYLDGPEEYFYLSSPTSDYYAEVDIPEGSDLHIIPDVYDSDGQNSEIKEWMMGIAEADFELNHPYEDFSGKVIVFYNESRENVAVEYEVVEGSPRGTCTLKTPSGEVFIERQYDLNTGEWLSSSTEPYGADWTFSQAESSLWIKDKKNAFTVEKGVEVVSIMPTNQPTKDTDNYLYTIMMKESFNFPFQINDQIFTGILRAYFHPKSIEGEMYFELMFKDGLLDGEIEIYNEWGELTLREIFVMGELDTTLFVLEYEDGVAKPIIYMYPEKDMLVDVKLDFDGRLTHTYPKYKNGWTVLAKKDGTLFDEHGKEYYSLYWEGQERNDFNIEEGFVIKGSETVAFLEKALSALNLNRREANEFIIYWLPQMENNPYNLIHFSTKEYEEMAQLHISPKPETLIRVMMVFQPLEHKIDFPVQDISKMRVDRKGFTVVEWGGKKLSPQKILL